MQQPDPFTGEFTGTWQKRQLGGKSRLPPWFTHFLHLVDSLPIAKSMAQMLDSRNWFKSIPSERRRKLLSSQRSGLFIEIDGKQMVNFASNDYLGLATDPNLCNAAVREIQAHGLGSGASRLISGDDPLLHRLEHELAAWKGFEACLVIGSGMLANIGLLQALANRHTHLFTDRLNHASLVDGARLSEGKTHRYNHLDMHQLEEMLKKHSAEQRIIVSDGVFSMDGDAANLTALMKLAKQENSLLLIDDAHGTGVVGKHGRGVTDTADIAGHAQLIEVGTLGKAFGCYGAFVLGTAKMIEGLRQRMRTLIYSTALPAALPAAALEALKLIRQGDVVRQLQYNLALFKQITAGLPLMPSETPIQPLLAGSDMHALEMSEKLKRAGFFVSAIRPPTVPEGTSRLRITLSAAHSEKQIHQLVQALKAIL
ncbi:MAG: 8-amino-7-oxononanoate synthase [Mariprofundaceae bacterium]